MKHGCKDGPHVWRHEACGSYHAGSSTCCGCDSRCFIPETEAQLVSIFNYRKERGLDTALPLDVDSKIAVKLKELKETLANGGK